jgi:hypothetical protein
MQLNLLIRELFQSVPDELLHLVPLPDFTDQSFVRQLMLGTEAAKDPKKSITSLYTRHPALKARLEESSRYKIKASL